MKAYLQHGPWGGPYTSEEVQATQTEIPWKGRTSTGYGKRLPTSYMVKWRKRWYRVVCICFSNSGTTYIRVKSVPQGIVVRIDDHGN